MKSLLFCPLLGCALICQSVVGVEVADNFSGRQIDTNIWSTYLGFANSSLIETNGFATLRNGAELLTWQAFDAPLELRGRLRFSESSYDNFMLVFRTTGMRHIDSIALTNGISIRIEPSNEGGIISNSVSAQRQSDAFVYAKTNRTLIRNQFYDFRLSDTGTNFSFYLGDLTIPLLTGTEPSNQGGRIAFYNHLAAPGPVTIVADAQFDLDFVDINSPAPATLAMYTAVELEFLGELGKTYQLQASPDSQTWTNLNEQISGDGTLVHRFFSVRGMDKLFYRAQEVASPDQQLIDRAQAAPGIAECIANARASGLKIDAGVNSTTCPNGGTQNEVLFSGGPNCDPGKPCPEFLTRIIAKVTFDCGGQIISAQCSF